MSRMRHPRSPMAGFGAAAALVVLAIVLPATGAGADAPAAEGWWSQASSLPPPPDVSSDGLYVQGGPDGPIAIAALRFQLPDGSKPDHLVLVPNGAASPSAAVEVCPLKPDSVEFKPAQNGAWADAPAYDCTGSNAIAAKVDDSGALTFDVGSVPHDGVLAVAVIATGPTDRVPIAKPDASTLTTVPSGSASTDESVASPSYSYDAGSTAAPSFTAPATSPSVSLPAAPSATTVAPSTSPDEAAASAFQPGPDAPLAIAAASPHDLATRFGGIVAITILVAALVAYSLGYGLLGGRFVDP